jgi:HD-GYP domain-containing protein (c-di-GMP phosphodiesterase class II)
MSKIDPDDLLQRFDELNRIGTALSKEKDINQLLETILIAAKKLVSADGGTLYRVRDRMLHFEIIYNDSLNVKMGGKTGIPIMYKPIPLYDQAGQPHNYHVVTYAVLHDTTVNIEDAYTAENFDFSGTRRIDQRTGYRSKSFLTVPMKNHEDKIIGVLQLINAKDRVTGEVINFSEADQRLAESLASQAAIALTNRLLIDQLKALFESLINLIDTAIDEKSPYTSGHCQRVPILTMMIAEAVINSTEGPLKDFSLNDEELYELKIASLLHDCGKITTPVHVIDKATKLETIFDRIHLIDTRFEVLKRDAEIHMLREKMAAMERNDHAVIQSLEENLTQRLQQLEADREFLHQCNIGCESMPPEAQDRVKQIAAYHWFNEKGEETDFLSADEVYNFNIRAGTLNPEERAIINNHVALTHKMLKALPWPKNLGNIPEYASSHHEHLDGSGYHRGLCAEQLPLPARIICIADVFEALTARDRPYKKGKTLSEALTILGKMTLDKQIDPALFQVFMRDKVWLRYAEQYLDPAQTDTVDLAKIPGYAPW